MPSSEEQCLHPHLGVVGWHQRQAAAELCLNVPDVMLLAVLTCQSSSHPPAQIQHTNMPLLTSLTALDCRDFKAPTLLDTSTIDHEILLVSLDRLWYWRLSPAMFMIITSRLNIVCSLRCNKLTIHFVCGDGCFVDFIQSQPVLPETAQILKTLSLVGWLCMPVHAVTFNLATSPRVR